MPEPTTSGAAVAWALVAGLAASFFAAIGVTPAGVFWAAAGAFVGAGFAPAAGRLRAMLLFPAATVLSAKAGIVGAAWLGAIGALPAHAMAEALGGLLGIVFHPLTAALVQMTPALARLRLGVQQPADNSQEKP